VNLRHFENKAHQSWWLIHIEAWRQSGLGRTKYYRQHGLTTTTFDRWLNYVAGKEAARKHAEYQAGLRRQQRREAQEKRRKRRARLRFGVSTDVRNRAVQAFWAMHVEAMNWSGMSMREYAAALHLSPTSLRKWRDRLDDGEVDIDWRAHLNPSARPVAGTSANRTPRETGLTAPPERRRSGAASATPATLLHRRTEARHSPGERPGRRQRLAGRAQARIVTDLLFRWRVQFGVVQRKRAKLAPVALIDAPTTLLLRDLVQPSDGMTAIDLPDGRRVLAPAGIDPHAIREHVRSEGAEPGVKVHLALGYTDMRKGLDGLAMLVQQTLTQDPPVRLPRHEGVDAEDPVLGRKRTLPVHEKDRPGLLLFGRRWRVMTARSHDAGAARHADRGHRRARPGTGMEAGLGRLKSCGNPNRIERICFFESGDSGRFGHAVRPRRFAFRTGSSAASHSRYGCRRRASRRRDRAPEVDHLEVAAGAVWPSVRAF
jgi:hypothetical protein